MDASLSATLALVGQVLLGGFFIVAGVRNVMNWTNVSAFMATGPLPYPQAVGVIGIAMQFVGGLSVTFGVLPVIGSVILIAFLILASVLFHPFWQYAGEERAKHLYPCLANAAIAGGLLMVMARALAA